MALDPLKDSRRRVETVSGLSTQLEPTIIYRRVEKSGVNRMKREINSLKTENQNLRHELMKLQRQMQQQKMEILEALGESAQRSKPPEGFF
jgi:uncharacterized coiled-coil DUF342 family protein